METKAKGLTVLALMVMVLCAYALIAPAVAQPTPFMSYGHVYYENGTVCNGSVVNITNLNTDEEWSAEKNASSNYYQLILANGTDVNKSEILRFRVTCGSQSKKFNHTVTEGELNDGGIFNFNFTLVALTPDQQVWYLSSDDKPSDAPSANDSLTPHAKDNLMHKNEWAGTGTSFYLTPEEPAAWFYADTGAECGLNFGEHNWTAYIRTEGIETGDEAGTHLKVSVCKLDSGGNVTILAENTLELTVASAYTLWEINCIDNGTTTQDFGTGDWLAVRLWWIDAPAEKNLYIYYKAENERDSYIKSPSTDPGYPVPELPTIILISTGLLTLAGYVWLTKRRR